MTKQSIHGISLKHERKTYTADVHTKEAVLALFFPLRSKARTPSLPFPFTEHCVRSSSQQSQHGRDHKIYWDIFSVFKNNLSEVPCVGPMLAWCGTTPNVLRLQQRGIRDTEVGKKGFPALTATPGWALESLTLPLHQWGPLWFHRTLADCRWSWELALVEPE